MAFSYTSSEYPFHSACSEVDTTEPEDICSQILTAYELVENVLRCLTMKDLLHAKQVCKRWHDVINRSADLRQALFLEPTIQKITGVMAPDADLRGTMRLQGEGSRDLVPHPAIASQFSTKDNIVWTCHLTSLDVSRMLYVADAWRLRTPATMGITQPITARVYIDSTSETIRQKYIHRDTGVTLYEVLTRAVCYEISSALTLHGYVKGTFSDERTPNLGQASPLTGQYSESEPVCLTVLTKYELVERILMCTRLEPDDLARLARVCQVWKSVISQSEVLRPRLFLDPEHNPSTIARMQGYRRIYHLPQDKAIHPLLTRAVFSLHGRFPGFEITWSIYLRIIHQCKRKWREALIIQPPVQKVRIWSITFRSGVYNHREELHDSRGISLQALLTAIRRCSDKDGTISAERGWKVQIL